MHGEQVLPVVEGALLCGGWVSSSPGAALSRSLRYAPEGSFFAVSAEDWPWGSG